MTEEKVIQDRLMIKSSLSAGNGKCGPQMCTQSLLEHIDTIRNGSSTEKQSSWNQYVWDLALLSYDAQKAAIISSVCRTERHNYATCHATIEMEIVKTKDEIEQLKIQLKQEQLLRKFKEEYESIARVVNTLPSRNELNKEMEMENKKMKQATMQLETISKRMDSRGKQFDLLIHTIHDLEQLLKEDVLMDTGKTILPTLIEEEEGMVIEEETSPTPQTSP